MRSPALSPASWAGLPSSTLCNQKTKILFGRKPKFPPGVFPSGNAVSGTTGPSPHGAQATYPDHMVDSIDIAVAHVDADSSQGEAVLLARAVDDDGGPQAGDGKG